DRGRRRACEPLDEAQLLGIGIAVDAAIPKVRRFDDECIAFPVTAGIAHIEGDALVDVRAVVEGDNARLVNHLDADADAPRSRDGPRWIAGEKPVALEGRLLPPLDRVGQLLALNVFDATPLEFLGALERRALLVLVRVVALEIRVAPRGSWGRVLLCGGRRG